MANQVGWQTVCLIYAFMFYTDVTFLASEQDLVGILTPLGLQNNRTKSLIIMSQMYIADPPVPDKLRPSRKVAGIFIDDKMTRYPPTPASHLYGCGRYALDSYRIFCMPGDEWMSVQPTDKKLAAYLVSTYRLLGYCHCSV